MATLYRVREMGGKQIWHWAHILSSELFYGVYEARAEQFLCFSYRVCRTLRVYLNNKVMHKPKIACRSKTTYMEPMTNRSGASQHKQQPLATDRSPGG